MFGGIYERAIQADGGLLLPLRCGEALRRGDLFAWRHPDERRVICLGSDSALRRALAASGTRLFDQIPRNGGQVILPPELLEHFGERTAVLVREMRWIEIWPRSVWEEPPGYPGGSGDTGT